MAEILTLASPLTKPSQTTVRIERIIIDINQKSVLIQWLGTNGEPGSAAYPTPASGAQPTGATLISSLNTANLSTISLVKRILQRLQTDGYLPAGTIAGTPD